MCFCIHLRTNSDLCHLQHKMIGFYNWDEKCLQRGTDWVFKYSGLCFVFKWLIQLSSWGWAQSCSKHIEDSNKCIIEETVRQVGYLPELYEDARSEKYKKMYSRVQTWAFCPIVTAQVSTFCHKFAGMRPHGQQGDFRWWSRSLSAQSSSVFHQVKLIAFVIHAIRLFFNHSM